jgi:hypothetical protein
MLESLQSGRPWFDIRALSPGAITKALYFLSMLSLAQQAAAASLPENQPATDKTKLIKVCKADIQRFCDQANLKQECLVAHWDKISIECRGILGSSAGNRADDGS